MDGFDAIWLPDADVRFTTDGISAFLLHWACAFSAGAPVIAQPVMHGRVSRASRSQQFWPFNYGREWQPSGRLSDLDVRAFHTAYVEQQAPLVDARFFFWFGEEIGAELAKVQQTHNTDIGTDQLWCRAAAHSKAHVSRAAFPTPGLCRNSHTIPARWRTAQTTVSFLARTACRDLPKHWPSYWLDGRLLQMYKLSSAHVEMTSVCPPTAVLCVGTRHADWTHLAMRRENERMDERRSHLGALSG